jgi:hypothetical protein
MATGETGFGDVDFDLISVQYHSLKAGHDHGSTFATQRTRNWTTLRRSFVK